MEQQPYLSVDDVAARFGVNPTTVYRLAQRGELPGFKIGGQWRFSGEMLDTWVADRVTVTWIRAEDRQGHGLKKDGAKNRKAAR